MRRQVLIGAGVAAGTVLVIGGLVLASQTGMFEGRARQLLLQADQAVGQNNLTQAQGQLEELIATFPDSPWSDDALLKLGEVYEAQQQLVEARTMYSRLLEKQPDSPLIGKTEERLGQINIALLFSPIVTDLDTTQEVKPGDTLGQIAAANNTTIEFIRRANGLKSDLIRPKQKLKVPKGTFEIVVDKSQNQLLLTENDTFVKRYRVATGKDNSSPVGTFKIINKVPNPVWYTEGAVVPPESPKNILGTRWMGFDKKGFGIHGSVDRDAIGKQVTAGCVRMNNEDVEELFAIVPVGTEVTIVD